MTGATLTRTAQPASAPLHGPITFAAMVRAAAVRGEV